MGLFLVIAVNIPMMLFSGFYMRLNDIVGYLQWFTHVSYYRFGFEGGMLIVYDNRSQLTCSIPYCHFKNPSKLLEEFGMKDATVQQNYISLLIWIIFYNITFYLILKWKVHMSR
ncbi:hypothetical protein L9F63_010448 [Diploptera punctata]|uniref:ABC-2 type transporter transmembrane domain-containing protein n=1 Tax=Diploptera punctata TaxID=6984 RepID=A0AAD8AI38_DIPPU|nr:hypothetical protein L9F63_010448 [Diploptera punctata]